MSVIIGSRKSHLAKHQAYKVEAELNDKFPEVKTDFYFKPSFGDLNLDLDLSKTQSRGVFTADFLQALKSKECDLVVHSWKDLPIDNNPDTEVVATLKREDTRDLLLVKKKSFEKNNLTVLTSSPRRVFNLKKFFKFLETDKNLEFKEIRGNIPTRFNKFLSDNEADVFAVALAAVKRLIETDEFNQDHPGIWEKIMTECNWAVLPESLCPSAPAQGALAIETLRSNNELKNQLLEINQPEVKTSVEEERQILKKYGGGCHLAIGVTVIKNKFGKIRFEAGTFEGEDFDKISFDPKKSYPKIDFDKLWFSNKMVESKRKKLEVGYQSSHKKSFVVTREESFDQKIYNENDYVFVSGLNTWKKLIKKNIWVNGSLDLMGEEQYVDNLFKEQNLERIWLTRKGIEGPKKFKTLQTYELETQIDQKSFLNKSGYVWMSGELFCECVSKYPELRTKPHFFGMGRSFELAQDYVVQNNLSLDLYAFYNTNQLTNDLKGIK